MRIPNKVCIGITIEYFLNAKTRFQAQASQIDNYEYLIKKKKNSMGDYIIHSWLKKQWIKMKSLESDGFMFVFHLHELITVICKLTSIYKPLFLHS